MKDSIYVIEYKRPHGKKWKRVSNENFYIDKEEIDRVCEIASDSQSHYIYQAVEYIRKDAVK